jgi:hypothetical protein
LTAFVFGVSCGSLGVDVAAGTVVNVGVGGKAGVNVLVGELLFGTGGVDKLMGRLQATINRTITNMRIIR